MLGLFFNRPQLSARNHGVDKGGNKTQKAENGNSDSSPNNDPVLPQLLSLKRRFFRISFLLLAASCGFAVFIDLGRP
jgi:hypothetical protein